MAKVQSNNSWGAFGLQFVGSLIYLAVFFSAVDGNLASIATSTIWGGAGIWLPFFVATAALSSIALFFISFATAAGWGRNMGGAAMKTSVLGGFTLAALTFGLAGTGSFIFDAVLLGFACASIGSALSWKE